MTAKELFEKRFEELGNNLHTGVSDFPFGLDHESGQIWLRAQIEILNWVLEMMD